MEPGDNTGNGIFAVITMMFNITMKLIPITFLWQKQINISVENFIS